VWIEQYAIAGWVLSSVVTFEEIPAAAIEQATVFDQQTAVWIEYADALVYESVEDAANALRRDAPTVTQVFLKVCDWSPTAGAQWAGYWDTHRALAIDSPTHIDRWAAALEQANISLYVWADVHGIDLEAEGALIAEAVSRPGVNGVILRLLPEHWRKIDIQTGVTSITPFMRQIHRRVGDSFPIGLAVDSRVVGRDVIFADEWMPHITSLHPIVDWRARRLSPEAAVAEMMETWGAFGKPIYPVIPGDADALQLHQVNALAVHRHRARGLSWWRLGTISPVGWSIIALQTPTGMPPPQVDSTANAAYGEEIIVKPNDVGFNVYRFGDPKPDEYGIPAPSPLRTIHGAWGWSAFVKKGEINTSRVMVRWSPALSVAGLYEISAFIPARHARTQKARYRIALGNGKSTVVVVNQAAAKNQWVTLGIFELDSSAIHAGAVYLHDLTGEADNMLAFDAVRWRRVITDGSPLYVADGYDAPVGTVEERQSEKVWAGEWMDSSPFGKLYFVGTPNEAYHTGADLNLPRNADAHTPVYAAASGMVTFAARLPVWGNVIIIKHDPLREDGLVLYGRYAHVEDIQVRVGQRVTRGQQIARIGDAYGRWAYLLHFDLSPTTILEQNPAHWAGHDKEQVFKHYLDPREFIEKHRPPR